MRRKNNSRLVLAQSTQLGRQWQEEDIKAEMANARNCPFYEKKPKRQDSLLTWGHAKLGFKHTGAFWRGKNGTARFTSHTLRTICFPTSLVPSETVKKKCRLDRSVKWTSPLERHVATSLAGYCSRRAAARCCCSAFWRAGKRTEQHENLLLLSFSLFTECADEAKLFFLSTTQTKKLGAAYHQI